MGRTKLRGLEMAGIRIAIEIPSTLPWKLDSNLAAFESSPMDPDVHIGVHVAQPRLPVAETFFYESGGSHFEIGREASDWVVAVYGPEGRCERTARFDASFSRGEVTVSPDCAAQAQCPLSSPLDEILLLHRAVADGCLVLRGSLSILDGRAMVFLSQQGGEMEAPGGPGLMGVAQHLILRPDTGADSERDRIWVHATPWSTCKGAGPHARAPLESIHVVEAGGKRPVEKLSLSSSIGAVLQHAFAPIHNPSAAEQLFEVVEWVSRRTRVHRLNRPEMKKVVSFTWERSPQTFGFAAPVQ
jgi:hypothetical protein